MNNDAYDITTQYKKIILVGSAHPLRGGGIASFNERLARAFQEAGCQVTIYTFSLQYPAFLFPGKSQYSTDPPPTDLHIKVLINSINPFNWIKVGRLLRKEQADLILVRYWLPIMGPCLGSILRFVRKHTKVVCIADNIIPHEKRPGDIPFTRYFLKSCHAFVTLSDKVMHDLRRFTSKPAIKVAHPLYDNFGPLVPTATARQHLHLPQAQPLLLFFGFIRKYKGLDLLLEAMYLLKQQYGHTNAMPRLLVAGEFYSDETTYQEQIDRLNIRDVLILKTDFIPDHEVKYYLCAADVVVQPYKHATQSGVTPLAYHFECPMIVTNVGALAELVPHEQVGLVTEPTPAAIAAAIQQFFRIGKDHFLPHLRTEKTKYAWSHLVEAIGHVADQVQ